MNNLHFKGIAPIIAFVVLGVILAGLGGVYYFKQYQSNPKTTDPTANWKTYSSKDYSFKYPDQWYIENPNAVGYLSFFQIGVTPIHTNPDKYGNETLIITDYSTTTFDYLKNNMRNSNEAPAVVETTLNGKRALKSMGGDVNILLYHLQNGNDRILNINMGGDRTNASLFDQILSTFKFTDQNQAIVNETANWKTYSNDQYGIEMKYPNNLSVSFSANNGIVLEDKYNLNDGRFIIKLVDQKFEETIKDIPFKEVKHTQINERNAIYYSLGEHNQLNQYYTIKVNANQIFEIQIILTEYGSLSLEKQSKIFDQILSTFRFLK